VSDIVTRLRALAMNSADEAAELIQRLTAERDEARADAERWEDDALRLLNERNAAQRERDAARREVCARASSEQALLCLPQAVPEQIAVARGWDCFKDDAA
jgi:hypothetical protein